MSSQSNNFIYVVVGTRGLMAHTIYNELINEYGKDNVYSLNSKKYDFAVAQSIFNQPRRKIVIDFSHVDSLDNLSDFLLNYNCAYINGISNLNDDYVSRLTQLSKFIPVVYGSNFSKGYQSIHSFIQNSGIELHNWHRAIIDIHHAQKKDSPSQTALKLAELLELPSSDPNIVSLRVGGGVSEHTIKLLNSNEEISISFRINRRDAFIENVVQAITHVQCVETGYFPLETLYS